MAKATNKVTNVEERFSFSVRMAPKLPQAVPKCQWKYTDHSFTLNETQK